MKPNRNFIIITTITFTSTALAFILPALVFGATNPTIENPLGTGSTFQTIVERFTKLAQVLVIPLSTLMILISGFLYMTAGGSPERLKTAHKMLIWAIIGIALVLLATTANQIIESVLGVKK
jgi:uncharacterized membrane protein YidH (DUF202 family)